MSLLVRRNEALYHRSTELIWFCWTTVIVKEMVLFRLSFQTTLNISKHQTSEAHFNQSAYTVYIKVSLFFPIKLKMF